MHKMAFICKTFAASNCPTSTDLIPDLKISAMYAPEFSPNAISAAKKTSIFQMNNTPDKVVISGVP